jgi:hypothetical protein
VVFVIDTDVPVAGYRLYLRGNPALGSEPTTDFQFRANPGSGFQTVSTVHILDPGQNYVTVYGSSTILVSEMFAAPVVPSPVLGLAFEATFTSPTGVVGSLGPTVIEFDAVLVPEPAGLVLAGATVLLVRRRRR